MELKHYLRNMARRKGKMQMDEIMKELEEVAKDGGYETTFSSDDVLDDDMFTLRDKMGLEVEFYGCEFSPYWSVRW